MSTSIRRPLWLIHPSAFLLTAQLLLLLLYSVFDGLYIERALIGVFGLVVVVLRVWVIDRSPGVNWIAWTLAIPAFTLSLLSAFSINSNLLVWSSLLDAALYFYAAASLIASMMKDYQVTIDELFSAGATFTLLAWGFAYLYLICQTQMPGSFVITTNSSQSLTFVELLFLSFTNLSSAGLSDILPVTTFARVLLMLEQFIGVGYIAVVISRLVGLTIYRQSESRRE
jgi:hypothetical protein